MSRKTAPFPAWVVLDPRGRLQTARETEEAATDAARIVGGSNWRSDGYTVRPATITIKPYHYLPDMIENE